MGKLSREESRTITEEVSADIMRKRMACILKKDLSRYEGGKIAVIVYDDDTADEIWMRKGNEKLLYEVDVELYDRDVVEDVLKKMGFKKVW